MNTDYLNKLNEVQQILVDADLSLMQTFPAKAYSLYIMQDWRDEFDTFADFVSAPYPKGLYLGWSQFRIFCERDPCCREMLIKEAPAVDINGKKNSNSPCVQLGTSKDYILGRLQRDAKTNPKIQIIREQLINGKIKSASAAAYQAGYIKRKVQVDATPSAFAKKILQIFSSEEWEEIKKEIETIAKSHGIMTK